MKFVINSHINSTIALNHLLESMKQCEEFKNQDIIVVIGGYYNNKDYEIIKEDTITYIKCNHNSIDFTGLIALLELFSKNTEEYYFYMHDTCKVGPTFFKKVNSIDTTNVSSIRIHGRFSMNIGVYSQKIINQFSDFLQYSKNTEESKRMEYKVRAVEDHIFRNDSTNYILDNNWHYEYTGPTDYYNTGTWRIVEYYLNVDLYKIKANWGQPGWQTYQILSN
jgi:putative cell wall-binding protein